MPLHIRLEYHDDKVALENNKDGGGGVMFTIESSVVILFDLP